MSNTFLSYTAISERERLHPLRQYEIPVTHAISLAIPTLRTGAAGYARFASPAQRVPGQPQIQAPPDRWWVFSALDGQLTCYALCSAAPMKSDLRFGTVEITDSDTPLNTVRNRLKDIERLFDQVSPQFFAGQPAEKILRAHLLTLLAQQIPAPLIPQYRALAPDFFAWLES